jgi:WD40 repeat protein
MNSFYIFDIQSKEVIWKDITGNEVLFDVSFSPSNSEELCIVGVNTVYFCNMHTREKMNHAKMMKKYKNTTFTCVEYSKDGTRVITSTTNGLLIIWKANKENSSLKDIFDIRVSNCSLLNLKISESTSKIYCTDSRKKIYLINPDSDSIEKSIEFDADVKGIDINSKEKLLLGLNDGRIIIKNLKSERIREITYCHYSGKLKGLEFVKPNLVNKFIFILNFLL